MCWWVSGMRGYAGGGLYWSVKQSADLCIVCAGANQLKAMQTGTVALMYWEIQQ